MKFLTSVGLMAFLILSGGVSQAAPVVEYQFSGTVIDRTEDDNSFGGLNTGDPFVAKFVFDELSPDALPLDPANGRYVAISASLQIPHLNVIQPGGVLDVSNGTAFDELIFDSVGVDFQIRAVFKGAASAMLSDAMPIEFPPMNDAHVLNVFAQSGADKFAGTITSAIIIPEPAVLALTLAGLVPVRRRR